MVAGCDDAIVADGETVILAQATSSASWPAECLSNTADKRVAVPLLRQCNQRAGFGFGASRYSQRGVQVPLRRIAG